MKTPERILAEAEALILAKSFHAVGINEVLKAAEVPKGSFYYHFRSKEAFGVQLIGRYAEGYAGKLRAELFDGSGTARERLLAYLQRHITYFAENPFTINCLVVKLSGEVASLSPAMRHALEQAACIWVGQYAALIRQGHEDGSLAADVDAEDTALFLYTAWLGAMTQVSIEQSPRPFETLLATVKRLVC